WNAASSGESRKSIRAIVYRRLHSGQHHRGGTPMAYETVLIDVDAGVATLTLNRPDALNAFNTQLDTEFHAAMWELDKREDVRVIVVTGAGKAFSSGLDLTDGGAALSGAEAEHESAMGLTADTIPERSAFWKMRTPVIAAINGAAIGAALNVALL